MTEWNFIFNLARANTSASTSFGHKIDDGRFVIRFGAVIAKKETRRCVTTTQRFQIDRCASVFAPVSRDHYASVQRAFQKRRIVVRRDSMLCRWTCVSCVSFECQFQVLVFTISSTTKEMLVNAWSLAERPLSVKNVNQNGDRGTQQLLAGSKPDRGESLSRSIIFFPLFSFLTTKATATCRIRPENTILVRT